MAVGGGVERPTLEILILTGNGAYKMCPAKSCGDRHRWRPITGGRLTDAPAFPSPRLRRNNPPDGSVQRLMTTELVLWATLPFALSYLLLALIPLYIQLYCVGSRAPAAYTFASTAITVITFYVCPYVASTRCPQADIILRLGCGTAIMKALDMYFRRDHPPILKFPASPAKYAFYLLVELRYESFDISTARAPSFHFSDTREYLVHLILFAVLQCLPQTPVIKAQGVLFAIWLIWNLMHAILKYHGSQHLFGPIYRAPNLSVFWTETWHNAYTSPTRTLGYRPIRKLFGPIGGVLGGFGVMAIFHVWALAPYVKPEGLVRVAVFFFANGVGSILDYWLWGKKITPERVIINWAYEIFWSQWTVAKCDIPDGLMAIDFRNLCRV